MKKSNKHIYFLCPGIEWDKPSTGGLLYNYVFIQALKKQYGDNSVTLLNLIGNRQGKSWGSWRIKSNLKYLMYFWKRKLGKQNLVLVDSRANSLLLFPLLFIRFFSQANIGMTVFHIYYHMSGRDGLSGRVEKCFERLFIRCATFIITISKSTLQGILQLTGREPSEKIPIRIIPPGLNAENVIVDKPVCVRKSPEINLLYVGTCEDPRKGLDFLIRAVSRLTPSNFRLYLVGKYNETSSYYRQLIQCIEDHKLENNVSFLGRVSDEKLGSLYKEADIFVFPSLWEGYGIVLAEAMVHGLPVVATDISSIPEIVSNGENGILVPPGRSDLLAQAISTLMDNDELRQTMAAKSLEIARKFPSWDDVGLLLARYVETLFNDRCSERNADSV